MQVWNTDEGLPHSVVKSIAQTPDGYLWVGTLLGGIARFDGQRFVNFHPGNTPELRFIEIRKLLVDQQGTLWVDTLEGRMLSYRNGRFRFERQDSETPDCWLNSVVLSRTNGVILSSVYGWLFCGTPMGATNRWETWKPPDPNPDSTPYADQDGAIWYRTENARLGRFKDNHFLQMSNAPGLRSPQINTLTTDVTGSLWVGTEKELAVWNGKMFVDMTPTNGELELAVRQIAAARDGSLWVRTDDKLMKCSGRRRVAVAEPWSGRLPSLVDFPPQMLVDSHGGVWLANGDALWHVSGEGRVSHMGEKEGLPSGMITCLFEDREGNLWVGLFGGGLARVRPRLFNTVWPASTQAARSVCEDRDGTMWFGTAGKSFLRWRGGEFATFTLPAETNAGMEINVYPGDQDALWVGSVFNGMMAFKDGTFERPFPASDIGTVARVLYTDGEGALWIGSEFGLFRWKQGRLKHFTSVDGFLPADVQAITGDKDGALWIGTAAGELRRFKAGRFETFRPTGETNARPTRQEMHDADFLQLHNSGTLIGSERFWALHTDEDGVVWIGTLGGGLLRFEEGRFTRYMLREGLPNENISQILEDQRDQLWLGTRGGIVRVSRGALNQFARGESHSVPFVTYGKSDGLPTLECSGGSQPACWRSRDGHLWFTTAKSAVWVNPKEIPFNPLPPPVVIEEISVDGQRVGEGTRMEDGGWRMEKALDGTPSSIFHTPSSSLKIPPGWHYLDFKFTAPSLTSPDKVRFKWRLTGLEKEWSLESTRRSVAYSFLPSGDYEFQVQACNNDGVWNKTGAAVRFTVLPYFWQTLWFRYLAIAFLAGSLVLIGRWVALRRVGRRLHALKQESDIQRERTRIAQDIHDELGANLTSISWLADRGKKHQADPKVVSAELEKIAATARESVLAMDGIVWALNQRNESLENFADYLAHFANEFFRPTAINCQLEIPLQLPEMKMATVARHHLFLAVKETLNNVLRHSGASEVWIRLHFSDDRLVISVEDNGRGFNQKSVNPSEDGLANLRCRMAALKGTLSLASGSLYCGESFIAGPEFETGSKAEAAGGDGREVQKDGTSVCFTVPLANLK